MGTDRCFQAGKHQPFVAELHLCRKGGVRQVHPRAYEGPRGKLIEAALAFCTKAPTEAEAAQLGLTVEEASGPPIEIWPDTMMSVCVFSAMLTQWNVGPGGDVGLNYASLPEGWRRLKVPVKDRD